MEHQSTISDLQTSLMRAQEEIERLREELAVRNNQYSKLEIEVADEIERLRTEVAYLKQGWYPTPATVQSYPWWRKEWS